MCSVECCILAACKNSFGPFATSVLVPDKVFQNSISIEPRHSYNNKVVE